LGYWAASYSIVEKSEWALDILVEQELVYDLSISPVYRDRYGISDSPRYLHILGTPNGSQI
jgi:hypothetical protein